MRRIKIISITLALLLMIAISSYAQIDPTLHFDVSYDGTVTVNEEKDALIILAGENAPVYSNVRVKVEIEGPAKPKLLATDALGTEIDIAEWGYWGPEAGFTVGGTFSNQTPIKATFTEEGAYIIKLSLLNVQNGNDILAEKQVTIQVQAAATNTPAVNEIVNELANEIINTPVEELPKTGTSLGEYAIYAIMLFVVIYIGYQIRERRT